MKTILSALILLTFTQQAPRTDSKEPGATVEGRVLNSDNSPAAGMTVELLRVGFSNEAVREWHPVERGRAVTDERGQFRISGLGPGPYHLRAIRRPPIAAGAITTASSVDWTPTTYFPGILNGALASSFAVGVGQVVNVDLTIPQTNPYTVSGRIVNSLPGGATLPIQLVLSRRDFGAPVETQSSWSLETLNLPAGSDGRFEIRGVPSGSYELFATARGQSAIPVPLAPNLTWVVRATFEIADQDIDDISAVLRPGVDVKGKLTVVGDSIGGTQVVVNLKPNDGSPAGPLHPPKINGETFTFDNVPEGNYSMNVSVAGERITAYVADIRSGGKSVFGENIAIGGSAPDPIEIVVNTNGASVPVTVVGKTNNSVMVVLVPAPPYRKNPHRYQYSGVNDPSGQVTVNHVAPGQYTVYAWEYPGTLPLPFMDATFITKYGTRGVQVNVTGEPPAPIEVPLVRVD